MLTYDLLPRYVALLNAASFDTPLACSITLRRGDISLLRIARRNGHTTFTKSTGITATRIGRDYAAHCLDNHLV